MITKEFIGGEEVFANDRPSPQGCDKCMFETLFCAHIPCTPSHREDSRRVYFRPAHDLKTLAAYHAQKHPDMQ